MKFHTWLFGFRVPAPYPNGKKVIMVKGRNGKRPYYLYPGRFGNGGFLPSVGSQITQVSRGLYKVAEDATKEIDGILKKFGMRYEWF